MNCTGIKSVSLRLFPAGRIISACAALLACGLAAAAQSGPDMKSVVLFDFEQGAQGWAVTGAAETWLDRENAYAGEACLAARCSGTNAVVFSRAFLAHPKFYSLGLRIFASAGKELPQVSVCLGNGQTLPMTPVELDDADRLLLELDGTWVTFILDCVPLRAGAKTPVYVNSISVKPANADCEVMLDDFEAILGPWPCEEPLYFIAGLRSEPGEPAGGPGFVFKIFDLEKGGPKKGAAENLRAAARVLEARDAILGRPVFSPAWEGFADFQAGPAAGDDPAVPVAGVSLAMDKPMPEGFCLAEFSLLRIADAADPAQAGAAPLQMEKSVFGTGIGRSEQVDFRAALAIPGFGLGSVSVPSPAFRLRAADGVSRRELAVNIGVTGSSTQSAVRATAAIRVEANGEVFETVQSEARPGDGVVFALLSVPETPGQLEVKVTATVGAGSRAAVFPLGPARDWKIFLAASSHTDIGYTDHPTACAERHCRNLDIAAELMEKYPDFKWNAEVAWQVENYLATRGGARLENFLRLAREGRMGVHALYGNMLTGILSAETAFRMTYCAHELNRLHAIPLNSAINIDVPTVEASIPMILANAGVRYLGTGPNPHRAPFCETADGLLPGRSAPKDGPTWNEWISPSLLMRRCPVWREGPDGSRVLMMFMHRYAHATVAGLTGAIEGAREKIRGIVRAYESLDWYPCDAIYLQGAVFDNMDIPQRLPETVKQWNERYESPKIIFSGGHAEFFRHVEETCGEKLPVVRGSGGAYWEDGAGSSARETAMCREAEAWTVSAEKLFALLSAVSDEVEYPPADLRKTWRNILLWGEHTWGSGGSVSAPESEHTRAQWAVKRQYAVDAHKDSAELLAKGMQALAGMVKTGGPTLLVFNPLNRQRTDVLRFSLPAGLSPAAPDAGFALDSDGAVLALAQDMPECGYLAIPLAPTTGAAPARAGPIVGTAIESDWYRVSFDPANGSITSVIDKELGRELVDTNAPHGFNEYLYVSGGEKRVLEGPGGRSGRDDLSVFPQGKAILRAERLGSLGQRMTVETSSEMTPAIRCEVTVWNGIKRVDIANRLTKNLTYNKEAAYFAFPFAARSPQFRYEAPAAVVNVATDMLPGACLDWFAVQHFVEVESGDGLTVTWSPVDAPFACFQDIFRGKWQRELPLANGHVYSYIMNNYWFTNYRAGQDGEFLFRYSITSRANADAAFSAMFGRQAANPPITAVVTDVNAGGRLPEGSASLLKTRGAGAILTCVKRAEAGTGLVMRLWNATGADAAVELELPFAAPARAALLNLVELEQAPLTISGKSISVPIRGRGLACVLAAP